MEKDLILRVHGLINTGCIRRSLGVWVRLYRILKAHPEERTFYSGESILSTITKSQEKSIKSMRRM